MKAREVMTHPVISVRPHVPVHAAAALLVTHGFTAAPVVNAEGEVLGMVTESDLLRGQVLADDLSADAASNLPVAKVMTVAPVTVGLDADLGEVAASMLECGARSVLVIDNERLVGILTWRDVLRRVARTQLPQL